MRKFKFMSKFAVGVMAAAMTMGSLSGAVAHTPVAVYAAGDEQETAVPTSVDVGGAPAIVGLGGSVTYSATVYDQDKKPIASPTVTWSVTGAAKTDTKIEATGKLTVAKDETAKELTITAKCGSAEGTATILVGTGVIFEIDYETMTGSLSSNGDDTFFFLEVLKDAEGKKPGTPYCYEDKDAYAIDLSFLKLSKDAYVRVYGNENPTPLKIYTIASQAKKPSIKYVAGQGTLYKSFQLNKADLTDATAETLQWKTQYESEWNDLSVLEERMDSLAVAGSTILMRQIDPEWDAPATVEVKVKISAAPKAPKVTLDYAKNAIKLAKDTEIRIPGWEKPIPVKTDAGETVDFTPFYYEVSKDDLSLSPAGLAEKLVTKYIEDYNKAQGGLSEDNQVTYPAKTTEDKEGVVSDKTEMLKEMEDNGYSFLIRTKAGKKAASQPTFVDVKAAPVIEIRKVASSEKDDDGNPIMVDDKAIAITTLQTTTTGEGENAKEETKKVYGDALEFEWKEKTGKMKEAELVLKPASGNKDNTTFSYSLDGGTKWNAIKKETSIGVSKVKNGIVVRAEGTKEDAKKEVVGAWASESLAVPVAVGEITIEGEKEIQAGASQVKKTYKVTSVKDFLGNTLKLEDQTIVWSAEGLVTGQTSFDGKTQELAVESSAKDGKVTIKATCGGKEVTYEVTIKEKAAEN